MSAENDETLDFTVLCAGGQAVAILLEAKAACANVMQWVTLPRNYNIHEYRLLLGQRLNHVLPFTLAGLEGRLEVTLLQLSLV